MKIVGAGPAPRRDTDPRDRARYAAMAQDERYVLLKGRFGRLTLVMGASFLGWYLLYVVASAFAGGFMRQRLFGDVNVALVFGVAQFASTFLLAWRHARYSREVLDPLADQVVADAERRVGERP